MDCGGDERVEDALHHHIVPTARNICYAIIMRHLGHPESRIQTAACQRVPFQVEFSTRRPPKYSRPFAARRQGEHFPHGSSVRSVDASRPGHATAAVRSPGNLVNQQPHSCSPRPIMARQDLKLALAYAALDFRNITHDACNGPAIPSPEPGAD